MKNEATALCDAAEAFQEACNALHQAQEEIAAGEGGTPLLCDVQDTYSARWRTLTREVYYARKAIRAADRAAVAVLVLQDDPQLVSIPKP